MCTTSTLYTPIPKAPIHTSERHRQTDRQTICVQYDRLKICSQRSVCDSASFFLFSRECEWTVQYSFYSSGVISLLRRFTSLYVVSADEFISIFRLLILLFSTLRNVTRRSLPSFTHSSLSDADGCVRATQNVGDEFNSFSSTIRAPKLR